jgi:hypothetical protein
MNLCITRHLKWFDATARSLFLEDAFRAQRQGLPLLYGGGQRPRVCQIQTSRAG